MYVQGSYTGHKMKQENTRKKIYRYVFIEICWKGTEVRKKAFNFEKQSEILPNYKFSENKTS